MEHILKQMIDTLQNIDWGDAQENVDGALAYLGCAVHDLRQSAKQSAQAMEQKYDCTLDVLKHRVPRKEQGTEKRPVRRRKKRWQSQR